MWCNLFQHQQRQMCIMDGKDEKEMHVHQRKEYIKFCMSIVKIDICPENRKCAFLHEYKLYRPNI